MLCAHAKATETTESKNTAHPVYYRMLSHVTCEQVIESESGEVITFVQMSQNN